MNRLLLVVLALLLAALGWQTWRLADASQTISTQASCRAKARHWQRATASLLACPF